MGVQYSYEACLAASERVNWRVEDIIGGDKRLDFTKPFMPESLARVAPLDFLTENEKRALNQIRGHGYLYTFGLVEEFIVPFVLDHIRPQLQGDDLRVRAFLQFATEEAKHIDLFNRFREEFVNGFGSRCDVIGPAEEIARTVLAHHPLAVALVILQIEWMTQRHFIESVKDDGDLDPQFKSLLRHHWMEEAQHAKLDTLMIEALIDSCTERDIDEGLADYAKIGALLDGGLMTQVEFDMASLARATGRVLNETEAEKFCAVQKQALRWTFLGSGMTHPNFLQTLERVRPAARRQVEEAAPAFS